MSNFIHLHVHTDYSLLDGAGRIKDYIKKCKEFGMDALAITDHGNMFGAVDFYNQCTKAGIKPIVGSEFYLSPLDMDIKDESNRERYHLILLAKNEEGYRNLIMLSSVSWTEGFYTKPRIDKKHLEQYSSGIVCLSACIAGEIPQLILGGNVNGAYDAARWYEKTFGKGNFFIEIQRHDLEEEQTVNPVLVRLSKDLNIPLVATNDAHYVNRDDAEAQDILMCIGMGRKLDEPDRFKFEGDSYYLKTPDEMRELFSDIPEAVENSLKVSELCNLKIDFPGGILPVFDIPEEFKDQGEYLTYLANEGLKRRYGKVTKELQERLDYELSVINRMNFPGYFLIVYDYVHWAQEHDVPVGLGRGSGAGSLVAYSVGITGIDPMKYGLLFERFLNPERVSLPDFDIDFCADRRMEVVNYVTEKYGSDKVGQICTFGTLKAKNCIDDVARVLGIPLSEVKDFKSLIVDDLSLEFDWLMNGHTRDDGSVYPKNEEFIAYKDRDEKFAKLFEIVPKLEGMVRNVSTHAAGVVIGRETLCKYVPLYFDTKKQAVATQYTMKQIEDCGLVKMDFLGLKTLTLIRHAEDFIRQRVPSFSINEIPEDDEKTFKMLSEGRSQYVFQFESSGMQSVLRDALPENITDLAALNALYRPGPMDNIPQYVANKANPDSIVYPYPELKELLAETFGIIVYQEQVMKVAQIYANYTMGQADTLRKIMGKKKIDQIPKARQDFIEASVKNGKSKKNAEDLFKLLEPFAGYGFNKSHAFGYAVLAYQTAYLKANYPVEFMAANLIMESQGSDPDALSVCLSYTRECGIEILPADVNESGLTFSVSDGKIVYGLSGIKNVGENCVRDIIAEREKNGKYKDFIDFLRRLDSRAVNQRVVQSLIYGGAFDSFGMSRDKLDLNLQRALEYTDKQKRNDEQKRGGSLFDFDDSEENRSIFDFKYEDPVLPWTKKKKLEMEFEALGTYVTGHPLDEYAHAIKRYIKYSLVKIDEIPNEEVFDVIVIVRKITEKSTKTGNLMASVLISDMLASKELLIWSNEWVGNGKSGKFGCKGTLVEGSIYRMEIKKTAKNSLVFKSLKSLTEMENNVNFCRIYLKGAENYQKQNLVELKDYLLKQKGSVKVNMMSPDGHGSYKEIRSLFTLKDDSRIYEEIKNFDCVESCRLI